MTKARRRRTILGSVALVGAGPGDPGLITVRGLALLRGADVVVYDRLGAGALIGFARADAKMIYVGKQPKQHTKTQAEITRILVQEARAGRSVVRLKGGDPFVFGRGGEEAEALAAAGIPFEVVPGITSAIAGPAAAGIPVTHRDAAASVAIATAHEAPGKAGSRIDWRALAGADTAVLLMGVERLAGIARALIDAGKPASTPAAVIQDATLPTMRTVTAPLSKIAAAAARAGIRAPAITVVGEVVSLREALGGWDTRPLSGKRVLVTRTREQASELSAILSELGAEVIEAPAIRVEPPASYSTVDDAVSRLAASAYAWVVFTSANGVRAFVSRLRAAGLDARAFGTSNVAAVGPGTAEALGAIGIVPDLVPPSFTTEAIGRAFPKGKGRVLLARADKVEPGLDDAIGAKGWTVDRLVVYRLKGETTMPREVRKAILGGGVDVLTFASGGTVRAFMKLLKAKPPARTKVVCIGPITAKAARAAGLRVAAVARTHTIPGLVAATVDVASKKTR
ncbi:MAG TPA: uroporphyrinogen-III C-methyltransferase [Actinomycetota bacterium]|nr:uroporphyrinogen-III C-methyltransferase [Actinomycetota bacterium]